MNHTTQCPSCQTRFKVSDTHLAAAKGLVRCGRCAHVFNALDHLDVPTPPPPPPPPPAPADDFELELPDFDPGPVPPPETAPAPPSFVPETEAEPETLPPAEPPPSDEAVAQFQQALAEALRAPRQPAPPIELPEAQQPLGNPFADLPEPEPVAAERHEPHMDDETRLAAASFFEPLRPATLAEDEEEAPARSTPLLANLAYALLALLGLLVLAGQLVFFNRTRVAAEVPELRPVLEAICERAGCEVPLPTDRTLLRTEWSELVFVPDQPSLVQLSATLKNHAAYPQAYPALELTLNNSDDQVLVRRLFPPKDYLKPADLALGRFNANSEVKIQMRMDIGRLASRGNGLGYNIAWVYP